MLCGTKSQIDKQPASLRSMKPYGGDFSPELAKQRMPYGIGQFARQRKSTMPEGSAEFTNAVQKWLIENTRLGIPAVFHDRDPAWKYGAWLDGVSGASRPCVKLGS